MANIQKKESRAPTLEVLEIKRVARGYQNE
jgi:hypothetical protein